MVIVLISVNKQFELLCRDKFSDHHCIDVCLKAKDHDWCGGRAADIRER